MKPKKLIVAMTIISIFSISKYSYSGNEEFSPNLDGLSLTDINLIPPTPPLNAPTPVLPTIFDIPTPPPVQSSIKLPKIGIPINSSGSISLVPTSTKSIAVTGTF